ncbi:MAG: hypothetical protein ACR2JE_11095 [Acidobacteriaceae bacterium]
MKWVWIALLITSSAVCLAQSGQTTVYLDPNSPFSGDFSAAVQKKNLPVVVTLDPTRATYMVTFQATANNGSIFKGVTSALTTGTYNDGAWDRVTMQVVNAQTKDITFSYTCKKESQNSSDPSKSVAECLAKHWKKKLGS